MNNSPCLRFTLPDEAATRQLGQALAGIILQGNLVIYLHGDLGTGKTALVRAILQSAGYQGKVKSPTYTLVESYSLEGLTIHHFDLYRLTTAEEWADSGLTELFHEQSLCLIEWPEKAQGYLPEADLQLDWQMDQHMTRQLTITALSKDGIICLDTLSTRHDVN